MRPTSLRPFLFGLAALLLAYLGQRALRADAFVDAALLYGAAALLFVGVFWRRVFAPERVLVWRQGPMRGMAQWAVWGAVLCFAGAGLLTYLSLRTFQAEEPASMMTGWWQHIGSVLLALAGAVLLDLGRPTVADLPRVPVAPAERRLRWLVAGSLLAILALATFFRLYRFADLPFGIWYDEAEHGLQAQRILASPEFRPIFEGSVNGPAHYLYLVAGMFQLFGESVQSVRAVSVVLGLFTVLAGYLVGRELFGRTSGLVLAYLLAVSSWLVTLNRFGMYSTSSTPLFTLLTIGFLLRAMRTGRNLDYSLAGLWIGLGLCFYTSFRLFIPVVAIFILHSLIESWWRTRRLPALSVWVGLVLVALVAVIVVAPVALYAYLHPDIFWARIQNTFVFNDKGVTDPWLALGESIRKHLLMYNWRGDPNGRHNLPGAPMLDTLTATVFVLGVAYSLRRALAPRYLLLLLWLAFTLLGGILSLDFESPQSHRANGTLTAAYLLAVIPVAVLLRAWRLSAGRYYPRAVLAPLALALAFVGYANYQTYFVAQANDFAVWNAFSTPETIGSRLVKELDPATDAYVTVYFDGHPTMRFLGVERSRYNVLPTTAQLPMPFAPDRNALIVLNADGEAFYKSAQRFYPNAQFEAIGPPTPGPPVVYTIRLTPADIAGIQGLAARYFATPDWSGEPVLTQRDPVLDFDWAQQAPLPTPFSVEWEGVLRVPTFGEHDFFLDAPGQAELLIGEQRILSGTGTLSGTLPLAEGNHALRVRAVGAPGRLAFYWRTPAVGPEIVPATVLFVAPVTANGLLGRYFANGDWRAPERLARIDDQFSVYYHVPPLPRPYTVEWTGKIAIPETGRYGFGLESIDESALWLDEQLVVQATEPNAYMESALDLTAGLHDLRIRFADRTDHTHINVYWLPPNGSRQVLPAEVLFPPQGSYARVTVPELSSLRPTALPPPNAPSGSPAPAPALPGAVTVMASGLDQPRGLAIDGEGLVYVASTLGGKVTVHRPDGAQIGVVPASSDLLGEPADVAASAEEPGGYVVDAAAARLLRFTPEGETVEPIAVDPAIVGRARGIALDGAGNLWVAMTAGGRVVQLAPDGAVLMELASPEAGDAQPTDVAVGLDGRIFVADPVARKLTRYSATGQRERMWEVAAANTMDSPHLATDAQGRLYLTDPEAGRVLLLDATGEAIGMWDLPALLGRFVKPIGVAVGPDGRVWVTDVAGGELIAITPEQ